MASTREKLIDWLAELPDNTEIGIEDEDLVAMIGTKAHFFTVGQLSDEAIGINLEAYSGLRKEMMARMLQIHDEGAGEGTDEGAMVVNLNFFPNEH